jgi:hypothetical protein
VRPGKAGPKGVRGAKQLMKFGFSSSGCDPRPAKGEPAQPVASLATVAVTRPAMRRCASEWAVGIAASKSNLPWCREGWIPRRPWRLSAYGQGRPHRAGCTTTARSKRTSQTPGRPTFFLGNFRSDGDPVIFLRRAVRTWMRARPADATQVAPHRTSIHAEVGRAARGDRSGGRRERGSRRAAYELRRRGTGWHPDPAEQKAARVAMSFRREP